MTKVKGIDISEWNGTLNFTSLKNNNGIEFVIIRCGYGTTIDDKFIENVKGCESAGLPYGLYHFCYATTLKEVQEEEEYVKGLISKYCTKKPFVVCLDFEGDTVKKAAAKGVTIGKTEFNAWQQHWCKYFTALGYKTPVYLNYSYYKNWYNSSMLGSYGLWCAYYQNECFADYAVWQQSSTYKINGKNFDLDYSTSEYINGGEPATDNNVAKGMQTYKNGSTIEYVYSTTALTEKIGSLNANESCYCFGRADGAYLVCYKVDGTANEWKCGYVEYNGCTTF